mgnify:CR=1 FL=1
MSKENMSKKNILDYDEEKTIRPQNFTLTAMKEFYDTSQISSRERVKIRSISI